jgi:hypothetical protein
MSNETSDTDQSFFEVLEILASLKRLHGTKPGEDLFLSVYETMR